MALVINTDVKLEQMTPFIANSDRFWSYSSLLLSIFGLQKHHRCPIVDQNGLQTHKTYELLSFKPRWGSRARRLEALLLSIGSTNASCLLCYQYQVRNQLTFC